MSKKEEIIEENIENANEEIEPTEVNEVCDCAECSGDESVELQQLREKVLDLDNKTKYAQAELVNYRKRKDEEVSNMLKYANEDLIVELIPALDNIERALKLANRDDEKLNQFIDGFTLVYTNIKETLKKFGVEEIEALGKEFDPNLHLALLTSSDKEQEDDIVLEVLVKGYLLKGRMIRPASVKVNKLN